MSRNPMYLALLLLLVGWAVQLGSVAAALVPPLFVWVINSQQIKWEEQALERVFGQAYLRYKQQVRRWL
jgi:protein-S-isoprenylcysteine O-methyltransferase Ste14